ncbi:MAG: hypothetical protein Rubg2KO_17590 [Rubricoccaceae bacterium]
MRVLLLSLVLAACSAPAAVPPADLSPEDELAQAQAQWADASLDAYEMTITRSCFCPPEWRGPYTATVEEGTMTSFVYVDGPISQGEPPTVEGLFELLETAYTEGAARVDVTYHEDWGYPVSLYIDKEEMMADEEIGYTVSELIQL